MRLRSLFTVFTFTTAQKCWAATSTVTLFAVETTHVPVSVSETFSPIGTGSDGKTTYFNEIIASVYYEQFPTTTFTTDGGSVVTSAPPVRTYTSDPLTIHATLAGDASHFEYHKSPNPTGTGISDLTGNNLNCDLDGNGGGRCVDERWLRGQSTFTSTYTGSAVPYYTLVVEASAGGPGGSQAGTKDNGAIPRSMYGASVLGWGLVVVLVGVEVGLFHV